MTLDPSRQIVTQYNFASGYPTTTGTIEVMAELVRSRHTHPVIRARARQIVAGLQPMDIDGEIRAVWDFIMGNVRYVRDPIFAEFITDPLELDHQVDEGLAMEDCEGIETYAATILASIGIPSEFETQGRDPSKPKKFRHCAMRVQNPRTKAWVSFDPVGAWEFPGQFDLGDSLHVPGHPLERFGLDGKRADALGGFLADLLGDALGDAYSNEQQAKGIVNPIADGAMAFGPYGMLVGGLAKGGLAIADAEIGDPTPPPPQRALSSQAAPGPWDARLAQQGKPHLRPVDILRGRATTPIAVQVARAEETKKAEARAQEAAAGGTTTNGVVVAGAALLIAKLLGVI